ncbi:MAG: malto-oligosyltrehalose synthase [Bacteroidia bacterium]|nr:malto-oligosyltrehalose synthase [Bacteroidia bacterium]
MPNPSQEPIPGELLVLLEELGQRSNPPADWQDEWKQRLAALYRHHNNLVDYVTTCINRFQNNPHRWNTLLQQQHYTLYHWKATEHLINYRRFFTVNDLICLRMEDEEVFEAYHNFILKRVLSGQIQGLRVDHVDGLLNPSQYLRRLRQLVGPDVYLIVEKILENEEILSAQLPIQGNTGYDFLALSNQLFTYSPHQEALLKIRDKFVGQTAEDPHSLILESKAFMLKERMAGEWDNLTHLLRDSQLLSEEVWQQLGEAKIKDAIGAFLVYFPVYRVYSEDFPLSENDRSLVRAALDEASANHPELSNVLKHFEQWFVHHQVPAEVNPTRLRYFLCAACNLPGLLMAKGGEDTAFYRLAYYIVHNEVGDSPTLFGIDQPKFHQMMHYRQARYPLSLNATSTHDTKRGEDVRARLNVISEIPELWEKHVLHWQQIADRLKVKPGIPDRRDEYFIYQSLLGAVPASGNWNEDELLPRMKDYLVKCCREAKRHSSWSEPNLDYEAGFTQFIENVFASNEFQEAFAPLHQVVVYYGMINSFSQVLLKCSCPGVPDVYQGTELWDLSLVDPDNRRQVDFQERNLLLRTLQERYARTDHFLATLGRSGKTPTSNAGSCIGPCRSGSEPRKYLPKAITWPWILPGSIRHTCWHLFVVLRAKVIW